VAALVGVPPGGRTPPVPVAGLHGVVPRPIPLNPVYSLKKAASFETKNGMAFVEGSDLDAPAM